MELEKAANVVSSFFAALSVIVTWRTLADSQKSRAAEARARTDAKKAEDYEELVRRPGIAHLENLDAELRKIIEAILTGARADDAAPPALLTAAVDLAQSCILDTRHYLHILCASNGLKPLWAALARALDELEEDLLNVIAEIGHREFTVATFRLRLARRLSRVRRILVEGSPSNQRPALRPASQ